MSPDDIDSLVVEVVKWLEKQDVNIDFDNDKSYDEFADIFYDHLERFCTRDRNYN